MAIKVQKSRGMSSAKASSVKRLGHAAEGIFKAYVGGEKYPGTGKRDVFDRHGNIHSVKAGENKWQWFLYSESRFKDSLGFHGAGYFLDCINVFPPTKKEYERNKDKYKNLLKVAMRNLKNFLDEPADGKKFMHNHKKIFLQEALFHSSEVNFLTVFEDEDFNIFDSREVIDILDTETRLENSRATQAGQMDDQKVLFKLTDGTTIGEIEMRNDKYRLVKFWMSKDKVLSLLRSKLGKPKNPTKHIFTFGRANTKFRL